MGLTVTAPTGAEFVFDEVKTERGTKSLGEVPILVWRNVAAALTHYGEEGIGDILDGTSLRVSFQNIARRFKAAGKTDDEIAAAQVAFKPGKRSGVSTPSLWLCSCRVSLWSSLFSSLLWSLWSSLSWSM